MEALSPTTLQLTGGKAGIDRRERRIEEISRNSNARTASEFDAAQAIQPWLSSLLSVQGSTVSDCELPAIRALPTEHHVAIRSNSSP